MPEPICTPWSYSSITWNCVRIRTRVTFVMHVYIPCTAHIVFLLILAFKVLVYMLLQNYCMILVASFPGSHFVWVNEGKAEFFRPGVEVVIFTERTTVERVGGGGGGGHSSRLYASAGQDLDQFFSVV